MYGAPPAIIEAKFVSGDTIRAYVGEKLAIFAVVIDKDGHVINSIKDALYIDIPEIEVLPQISPVLDNEKIISQATVNRNRYTRLASRNFRNQLFYFPDAFTKFKSLAEATWEQLRVSPIETATTDEGITLQLFVRVKAFEAELSWMGNGLQMWIQTMWFISQCTENSIVVLDEPDVYMHADLQRRLVQMIMSMFPQVIIATHSLEIIEEVPSDYIIPIDSTKETNKPIKNEKSIQELCENLGSPLNIDLARLFIAQRFIIWDGSNAERKQLSAYQSILFPKENHPIGNCPKSFVDGSTQEGWEKAKAIVGVFKHNKMQVDTFCIFNSGMMTSDEKESRMKDAHSNHINLHIWDKYEIDNYAINPTVILRYLQRLSPGKTISKDALIAKMREIVILLGIKNKTKVSVGSKNIEALYSVVPGRLFFKHLSKWTELNFNITISAQQLIPYFNSFEINPEIKRVLSEILR